jgi:DNA-directed RNA polymerase specialized sigma24 family protein
VAREAAERRRRRNPGDETALDAVVEALPRGGRHFEPMQDWSARIDEPALRSGLQAIIGEAIDALPADYRTALVLHDVEGVSRPDIADVLDVDVPVVKARVHRARLFVQQLLSEYFEPGRTRTDGTNKTLES